MKSALASLLLVSSAAFLRSAPPQSVPEPPLPGEDGPVPTGEAFEMLPITGEAPPESQVDQPIIPEADPPIESPPVYDQMPDLPPLGLPADGEAMPALPSVPGLIVPRLRTAPNVPADPSNPSAPQGTDAPPALEPLPDDPALELAQKAYWHPSPIAARKASVSQQRPLLIFFASKWDGECPAVDLVDDLFSQTDFSEFAGAHLVLTTVFEPVGARPPGFTDARMAAVKRFKEYFKVRSFPTIIVLDNHGRELERLKGYSRLKKYGRVGNSMKETGRFSTAHLHLQKIKDAVKRHEERLQNERVRRESLTRQGYRLWTSRAGSSLLAKLTEVRSDGIILMDEQGRSRRVHPKQLCLFDFEWARRKHAGTLPPPRPPATTTALNP